MDGILRSRSLVWSAVLVTLGAGAWLFFGGGPAALAGPHAMLAAALWIPAQVVVYVSPLSDLVPWPVANGSMYGLWRGASITWLAWLGAGSLQYVIGRRAARDFDVERALARLPGRLSRFPIGHPAVLIVGRWVPISSAFLNVAAGVAGVPFWRILWCTAIGAIPPALVLAAVGAGIMRAF
ncbi:MAG TPA: VTT domain-containing protein [Candidatus Binatia bacterium]|nr:VTT domain-containing protein [Candidatus Binatia bacterium]